MVEKTIVLGKGFLGKKFAMRGYEVWDKERFLITSDQMVGLANLHKYDVIVNCIAKSNTRWCEKKENFPSALWSNGIVPGILSDYCAMHNKKLVHISTGCLYDDSVFPQSETSELCAHLNYTVTKWVGEQGCNDQDLILRPRLLFGDFGDRNNLLCKLPKFTHFVTAYNSYTSVDTIVNAVDALLVHNQSGVFNVACDGYATVMDMALWIGLESEGITGKKLREQENLHLVNNTMNISKLRQFYQPPMLQDEVLRCWEAIK